MCKTWLCCLGALAALHIASTGFFVPSQPAPRDAQRRWPRKRRARVLAALPQSGEQMPALRYLGDPDLMKSQPCVLEEAIESEEVQTHLQTLRAAMQHYGGIGIAAPQIGWWCRAMCFGLEAQNERYPDAEHVPFQVWLNPEIVSCGTESSWMWEGCLSVPGLRGWVERANEVVMRGFDEHGQPQEAQLSGLAARIAQHELDHLDGILFPTRVSDTRWLVPQKVFDNKETWSKDWPSRGSYRTGAGALSPEA